jgi:chemotaxis protein CheD
MIVVGVSDAKASGKPDDVLITHALGSCIGVSLYDARACVGGMLHFQLPSSQGEAQRAAEKPLMYADTGLNWLLHQMTRLGAEQRRMQVRLAGGANMLNDQGLFDIGRRNHAAIRKLMWQLGMFIDSEQIGGKMPRTMQLNVADGALSITCDGEVLNF